MLTSVAGLRKKTTMQVIVTFLIRDTNNTATGKLIGCIRSIKYIRFMAHIGTTPPPNCVMNQLHAENTNEVGT